jgi:formylglycine-generating enzyme required for sulfatase activity
MKKKLGVEFLLLLPCLFLFMPFICAEESSTLTLVRVPAGSFEIGNKDFKNAQPVHKVILSNDFYMSKYEITNQQYADMLNYAFEKGSLDKEAMAETAKRREARGVSKSPQKYQDVFDEHSQLTFENGVFKAPQGKENYPVVEVTWYGAAFYCNMLSEKEGLTPLYNLDNWSCEVYGKTGYRLPTEAEWEYAAKYDDNRIYPWGNQEPDDSYANIKKSIKAQADVLTTPVGAYSPRGDSKLGIADMAGNVAELCNDWYDISYSDKSYETDPKGPAAGLQVYAAPMKRYLAQKVVRGGSFLHDPKFREGMGIPFLIDSVTRPEAFTTSGRSFDCINMSRQVEGFRVVKTMASEKAK